MRASEAWLTMQSAKAQGINPYRQSLLDKIKVASKLGQDSIMVGGIGDLDNITIKWFEGLGYVYTPASKKYFKTLANGNFREIELEEARLLYQSDQLLSDYVSAKISWGHFEYVAK